MPPARGLRAITVLACIAILSIATSSLAALINVGMHDLLPQTPGQQVEIFVAGGDDVQGLNLNAQVADGGPAAGGSIPGPAITSADIVAGTIFAANNSGAVDPGSFPQLAIRTITTEGGTVDAEGLLVTLTFDTTGFDFGSWDLFLSDTLNGPTDFAGLPAKITDGTIRVVPEPTCMLGGLGCALALLPRPRRRCR